MGADAADTVQKIFFAAGVGSGAVNLSGFWLGNRDQDVTRSSTVDRPISAFAAAQTDSVPVVSQATLTTTGLDSAPSTPTIRNIVRGILAVTNEVRRKLPESKILLLAVFPRDEQPDTAFRRPSRGG